MANAKKIVTGLDVGTDKVCAIIGNKIEDGSVDILGIGQAKSNGLRKGAVVDIEETITAVSKSLEDAEKMAGQTVENIFVSIGGDHISSSNSKGVIAVSRADGEIIEEDVDRVVEAARAVSIPANREIIHVIPRVYTVDGQEGIHDPVGMTGIRLEVETHVITGSSPVIKNLSKCIYQAGLDINELVFSPLASATILLSKQQKEVGVILVDIGAGKTDFAIFEEGDILHSGVIPIGASHITNDIAIGLRTSIDTAEEIKREYGCALPQGISEDEEIDMTKYEKGDEEKASRRYVAEIIEARLLELFSLISETLKKLDREGNLPAGIIFCGGGAKLNKLVNAAKEHLKLPAQVGKPIQEISGLIDKINDPIYTTAIGLTVWGLNSELAGQPSRLGINKAVSKAREWFKKLIP